MIGTISNSYTKNLITFSSSFLDSLQDDVKKRRVFCKNQPHTPKEYFFSVMALLMKGMKLQECLMGEKIYRIY